MANEHTGLAMQVSAKGRGLNLYRWRCGDCGLKPAVLAKRMTEALEAHGEDCSGEHTSDCDCGKCVDAGDLRAKHEAAQAGDDVAVEAAS